ncbi:hypothetical protein ABVT39_023359 [Epinephelus coioides]
MEVPLCPLCQKRGTLEHILSCRSKALGEGCCHKHYDQAPKAIEDTACSEISI